MEFMKALFSFEGAGEDAVAPILDKIKASLILRGAGELPSFFSKTKSEDFVLEGGRRERSGSFRHRAQPGGGN